MALPELDIDAVEEALAANMTFPARWYSDPDIYQFELEHIFSREWQIVAPVQRLAEPGDHVVCMVGRVPIVVTRDRRGALHGFVNVCRHRAYPVASDDGNRKTLQCAYHGWTYELDGSLRRAPRCDREPGFEKGEFSLLPVSVDEFCGFVWANPDRDAPPLREAHPTLEPLSRARGITTEGYDLYQRYRYDIAANWKVWVENATECYHCPTVHSHSFSDAWDVDMNVYEYVNVDRLLAQFTVRNEKGTIDAAGETGDFRFVYIWPSSFIAQDDLMLFNGIITPTGPESCAFVSDAFVRQGVDLAEVEAWWDMYTRTIQEDADAVAVQQPGLRSMAVPNGRLMPASESAISHFHRLVFEAFRGVLVGA